MTGAPNPKGNRSEAQSAEEAPREKEEGRLANLEMLGELGFELALGHNADDLANHVAALKDEQGRDIAHLIFLRRQLVVIDIHLRDFRAAFVFIGQGVDHGSNLTAWPAPYRPEVDQCRYISLEHFGFEVGVG